MSHRCRYVALFLALLPARVAAEDKPAAVARYALLVGCTEYPDNPVIPELHGPENVIKDDQVGAWLDRLRDKGASVWIVFDCCHAGTMTRGATKDAAEVSRTVDPFAFGVSREKWDSAVKRAAAAVKRAEAKG